MSDDKFDLCEESIEDAYVVPSPLHYVQMAVAVGKASLAMPSVGVFTKLDA